MEKVTYTRSDSWRDRANRSIAHGALTNSKRPASFVDGVYPTHVTKGEGCFLWDPSGKRYFDFIGGLGSCILGYGNQAVIAAAVEGLNRGATLSLGTTAEVETAEKLKEIIPFVDHVRFLKTGSEACSAALRIARAYTGKTGILSSGYHGWHDEFVSLTPPATGVPRTFECVGTLDSSTPDLDGIAAVIVEPVMTDFSENRGRWLSELSAHCKKNGTLLIFDEVITGFRVPKLAVANNFGVLPDLIIMGKAMANGLPVSVVAGRSEIMASDYFVSSTFAGEMASLFAARKVMDLLRTDEYAIERVWKAGASFITRFNEMAGDKIRIVGYPTRGVFEGDPLFKAIFWQEACKSGMLFGSSFFFHFGHIGHEETILSACQSVIRKLQHTQVKLDGEMPQSPFAQKVRNQ